MGSDYLTRGVLHSAVEDALRGGKCEVYTSNPATKAVTWVTFTITAIDPNK